MPPRNSSTNRPRGEAIGRAHGQLVCGTYHADYSFIDDHRDERYKDYAECDEDDGYEDDDYDNDEQYEKYGKYEHDKREWDGYGTYKYYYDHRDICEDRYNCAECREEYDDSEDREDYESYTSHGSYEDRDESHDDEDDESYEDQEHGEYYRSNEDGQYQGHEVSQYYDDYEEHEGLEGGRYHSRHEDGEDYHGEHQDQEDGEGYDGYDGYEDNEDYANTEGGQSAEDDEEYEDTESGEEDQDYGGHGDYEDYYEYGDDESDESDESYDTATSESDDTDWAIDQALSSCRIPRLEGYAARFMPQSDYQIYGTSKGAQQSFVYRPASVPFACLKVHYCAYCTNIWLADANGYNYRSCPSHDVTHLNDRSIFVFVDGACSGNGYPDARGGVGVFFHPDSAINISEPFVAYDEPTTNQKAEIWAVVRALKTIRTELLDERIEVLEPYVEGSGCLVQRWRSALALRVIVTTDSAYVVDCMTALDDWTWSRQEGVYRNTRGRIIHNSRYFRRVVREADKLADLGIEVVYYHVYRHENSEADALAAAGIWKEVDTDVNEGP